MVVVTFGLEQLTSGKTRKSNRTIGETTKD